jgi:hypothetical protein
MFFVCSSLGATLKTILLFLIVKVGDCDLEKVLAGVASFYPAFTECRIRFGPGNGKNPISCRGLIDFSRVENGWGS